ncbi:MAG: shikimate kinase [Winogradskyella sp.]|uniref:shikimate kinase n=1 Tax=Winogradskyella sp. TaxID=1883156 RepID=UPI00385FCBB4
MIIVLIGYMGSGKSTIGKELATALNYDFIDLDDYISDKEQITIPYLFKTKGEIYFRKKETEYLQTIIESSDNLVLALGGGTPCYGNNMDVLKRTSQLVSIYLKLSIPLLAERLFLEREERPLISYLNSKEDLIEFIGKHLFERSYYYSKAEFTLKTDDKTKPEILQSLLEYLI